MTTTKKLSYKSFSVLLDIAEGRGTHHNCRGQSEYGGRTRILLALERRGFIKTAYGNGFGRAKITPADKKYLEENK